MTTRGPPADTDGADLFDHCPVSLAFEQLGSKWRLIVMHCLYLNGEERFNQIQESTSAESATLSRVLNELEDRDLVNRRLEDRPIATYYQLSEKGRALGNVFEEIEQWAQDWTDAETAQFKSPS
jgi:DNA-binding HxlR family transcriptional regulator